MWDRMQKLSCNPVSTYLKVRPVTNTSGRLMLSYLCHIHSKTEETSVCFESLWLWCRQANESWVFNHFLGWSMNTGLGCTEANEVEEGRWEEIDWIINSLLVSTLHSSACLHYRFHSLVSAMSCVYWRINPEETPKEAWKNTSARVPRWGTVNLCKEVFLSSFQSVIEWEIFFLIFMSSHRNSPSHMGLQTR